jgi:hypothetical protein
VHASSVTPFIGWIELGTFCSCIVLLFPGVDIIPCTQTACAEPLVKLVEEAQHGVGMVYGVPRP